MSLERKALLTLPVVMADKGVARLANRLAKG